MEFSFGVASLVGAPQDYEGGAFVGRVDEESFHGHRCRPLCEVFDCLGKASALAQGLRKPVTSGTPHLSGQRIYVLVDGGAALGFLKVGSKKLFVAPPAAALASRHSRERSDVQDALQEINPVCVLDFYVHESCQRHGHGRRIFDAMLDGEGLQPASFAYDRPSPKLIGFLAKHFGLVKFRPQNNNYVVFDEYFAARGPVAGAVRSRSATGSGASRERGGAGGEPGLPQQPPEWARPPAMPPQQLQPQPQQQRQSSASTWAGGGSPYGYGESPLGAPSHRTPLPQHRGAGDAYGVHSGVHSACSATSPWDRGHLQAAPAAPPAAARGHGGHGGGAFTAAGMPSRGGGGCGGGGGGRSSSLPGPPSRAGSFASSASSAALRGGGSEHSAAGCPSHLAGPHGHGGGRLGGHGGGGGAQQRYASPLSHAGHRMVGQSPIC